MNGFKHNDVQCSLSLFMKFTDLYSFQRETYAHTCHYAWVCISGAKSSADINCHSSVDLNRACDLHKLRI